MSGLVFISGGQIGLIQADGGGLRALDLNAPNQVTWQPCGFLPDGRMLLLSMEPRRDGPGRPFDQYYTLTPTHLWACDPDGGGLEEIATRNRMAAFYTPQLLLPDGRILMQVCRPGYSRIFNMRLDGTDARPFTATGEGVAYGFDQRPATDRIAFHLAGSGGYQIWTCNPFGNDRTLVAAHPDHLYFAPRWSPDGNWLLYQDCHYRTDPGHDWSDLRLSRPDDSEHRLLTEGQAMWFAASYGYPGNCAGGSNEPVWTVDGRIIFPRRRPGSKVPWEYQDHRPDADHFNRDFKPEQARGGVDICRLDPLAGTVTALSATPTPTWDFRGRPSPDGRQIAFCRAATGEAPGLWVMKSDGAGQRLLTCGLNNQGVDHPRWLTHR